MTLKVLIFEISGRKFGIRMDLNPEHAMDRTLDLVFNEFGVMDPEIVHVIARVVRPGDTVIDGGANIGYFTLLLSQAVGQSGHVIAVEPGPNNLPRLRHNLHINQATNVEVIESPLWSGENPVTLHLSKDGGVNSLCDMGSTIEQVAKVGLPLSTLLPARFIKLDIEGAEERAVLSLQSPAQCPYVITELNEGCLEKFGSNQWSLRNLMRELGYDCFLLSNDGGMPTLCPPNARIATTRGNTNILFSTPELIGQVWSVIAV